MQQLTDEERKELCQRLRSIAEYAESNWYGDALDEAADEIERLEKEIDRLSGEVRKLRDVIAERSIYD